MFNFFHNKIKIGIVFDNEQKFHSSSMIFGLLKTPWIKSFFSQDKKFDRRRRLTLGPKKTSEVWSHNGEAGGIFL